MGIPRKPRRSRGALDRLDLGAPRRRSTPDQPPTAIIRTLPPFYGDESTEAGREHARAMVELDADEGASIYIALTQQPKQEVLHVYLCIAGKINVRLNLAGYEPGDTRPCFDGTVRKAGVWAICTGPVSRPPAPIARRGFQGHRYTEALW